MSETLSTNTEKQNHLTWIPIYEEFADKLLFYKSSRDKLFEKLDLVFKKVNMNFPKLEADNSHIDIDPFTVFGFFNKQITFENKIVILKAIKEVFELKSPIPDDFDSIPQISNLKAAFFYGVPGRGEKDIDNLWEIFEKALSFNNTNAEEISNLYTKCQAQKGINWNLSMGLFWIRPNKFIPLDANTRNCLNKKFQIVINKPIDGTEYFNLIDRLQGENFPELSYDAWKDKREIEIETEPVENNSTRYWLYAPGEKACKWDDFYKKGIMALGWEDISDLRNFSTREEIRSSLKEAYGKKSETNSSLALWQFANDMKPGDVIFVKKGMHKLIGRGVVESDYEYDASIEGYPHIRKVKWTHNGEWEHPGQAVMKTLTDITYYREYVEKLNALFDIEDETEVETTSFDVYDEQKFLSEVFITPEKYQTIVGLLERKKNIILQGAPGVGKSFAAKRLAYSIIGEKNSEQVKVIQFHQSYSYEDFIVGFRPSAEENKQFEKRYGVFYEFCKKAADDSENKYFFIIDEINRGNMSKIFGELLLLIENDKRGKSNQIQLLYSKEDFYIPENVYIIGMMNTADRSLAMLDYALRRRFAFIEFEPAFESNGFRNKQNEISNLKYDSLIQQIIELNKMISEDVSLGKGFRIGHSYFIPENPDEVDDAWLSDIVNYEIIPLLEEYWFDETDKLEVWRRKLEDSIK
ncbi:MAG: AAA family ATPase [Treponema sp.]|nr:AAA family ATPase [Treponema sp.]